MTMTRDTVVWGIHGGKTGDADGLFLKKNVVALGWEAMGDLSKIPADKDAFKERVASTYPDYKPGAVPTNAGQLFRFVHKAQAGDLIAYSSKIDRQVHLGHIEGPYHYDQSSVRQYPHRVCLDSHTGNVHQSC